MTGVSTASTSLEETSHTMLQDEIMLVPEIHNADGLAVLMWVADETVALSAAKILRVVAYQ